MSQREENKPVQTGQIDKDVFRAIADYTYDWENWHSPDGTLRWVNAAVRRLTGYTPEECFQMPEYPLPIVAEQDRDTIQEVFRDARSGGNGNDVEFQIAHRDGSARWGAVSWQPIYDDSGNHLGYRASIRDVTERHKLREELRLYNQHLEQLVQERTSKIAQLEEHRLKMERLASLGQMAARVAHEVNNPLAGIRNAFALFKANLSSDDENYDLLELIDSEIERISLITHQMYQLYRPSQQVISIFDLNNTISDVILLIEPLARKADINLNVKVGNCSAGESLGSTEVQLHEGEMKQILLNVVRNAIQASPPAGNVDIDLSTSPESALIKIIDEGMGISRNIEDKLYEPFFSTKSGPREGMGLGLSVSKSLIEAMGGNITLVNNPNGPGATATLSIPRRMVINEST